MESHPTVLVIGGGIAGLAAARELARRDFSVTLLEARPHLGGRILTKFTNDGVPVELGAEFVHGCSPNLWKLLDAIPLRSHEISDKHQAPDQDGVLRRFPFHEMLAKVTDQLDRRGEDTSFFEFLNRHSFGREVRRAVLDYVEGFHAARPERLSVHALAQAEEKSERIDGERTFRLTGGYGALVRWFEEELRQAKARIICAAEVNRVSWQRGRVVVEARVGEDRATFQGDRCLVTLPLGVLKSGSVSFEPALPDEKAAAIAALEVGHVTKVVLRFRERLWPHHVGFVHTFDQWLPTWWTCDDALCLIGWAGGPKGERMAKLAPEEQRDRALEVVARTFSRPLAMVCSQLVEFHTHDWRNDPFARMAYSYVAPKHADAPRRLADPVEDTLFFAGEAASVDGACGTVHGALNSGILAATQVERTASARIRSPELAAAHT